MPVGDENVRPAVVVEIEKFNSKTEEGYADRAEAATSLEIGKLAVVIIVVEIVGIVGEIGFYDVRPAVMIVVGGVDAHAGLLTAIRTVSHTCFGAHLCEVAFAVVVVEQARRGVVGYV